MTRDSLLYHLTVLDFIAVDLALYLDTHPTDTEAIAKYNDVIKEADSVRCKYEKMYGPLCSFRSMSNDCEFTWINNERPWSKKFNFSLKKEDC